MVDTAGTAFAAAIRRSYFDPGGVSVRLGWHDTHGVTPIFSYASYDAFAFESKATVLPRSSSPNSPATCFSRFATSPDISALADRTSWMAENTLRRSSMLSGRSPRDRRKRRFAVQQQHEELLAHQHLELRQRDPRLLRRPGEAAAAPRGCVRPPCRGPSRHRAARGCRLPSDPPEPIFDFSSAMRACRSSRCFGSISRRRDGADCGSTPTAACSAGDP